MLSKRARLVFFLIFVLRNQPWFAVVSVALTATSCCATASASSTPVTAAWPVSTTSYILSDFAVVVKWVAHLGLGRARVLLMRLLLRLSLLLPPVGLLLLNGRSGWIPYVWVFVVFVVILGGTSDENLMVHLWFVAVIIWLALLLRRLMRTGLEGKSSKVVHHSIKALFLVFLIVLLTNRWLLLHHEILKIVSFVRLLWWTCGGSADIYIVVRLTHWWSFITILTIKPFQLWLALLLHVLALLDAIYLFEGRILALCIQCHLLYLLDTFNPLTLFILAMVP